MRPEIPRFASLAILMPVLMFCSGWVFAGGETRRPLSLQQPDPNTLSKEESESGIETETNKLELEDPFRPRYIVESLEVRGNTKTKGSLILSHMMLKPGDSFDEEKVQLSRIRLMALGYFKDINMVLEKGSDRGRVMLVVEVEERNTIIIDDVFLGFSKTNPLWFGAGVSDINFLGRGLVLSGGAVASEHQQAFRLSTFWPSVFNSRFQTGFQILYINGRELVLADRISSNTGQPICDQLGSFDQSLPYTRAGGVVNAGLRMDRVHRISVDLHVEHIDAQIRDPRDANGDRCRNYPFHGYLMPGKDGQSTLSSLSFRFERDTRNDFFLPSSGMYLLINVELASKVFGSDYEFSKYFFKFEQSYRAFLNHAFRFTVSGGLIQDVGEFGSPFFTRFFVGDYALFQIDKDSLPRNLELNFSEVADYGDLMASFSIEYDIPLWSDGEFFYRGYVYTAANFSYVTKAEFLKSVEEEWSGRTKRPVSLDVGFKFNTPIGLFTLSFGYVFDLFL